MLFRQDPNATRSGLPGFRVGITEGGKSANSGSSGRPHPDVVDEHSVRRGGADRQSGHLDQRVVVAVGAERARLAPHAAGLDGDGRCLGGLDPDGGGGLVDVPQQRPESQRSARGRSLQHPSARSKVRHGAGRRPRPPRRAAWEAWLEMHHDTAAEAWLRIAKKGSGLASISIARGPRRCLVLRVDRRPAQGSRRRVVPPALLSTAARSTWSQVNVEKVGRLIADGRMRTAGLAQVEAAHADGRWAAAYERQCTAALPDDLASALDAVPDARTAYDALGRSERYAVMLPVLKASTPEARAREVGRAVEPASAAPTRPELTVHMDRPPNVRCGPRSTSRRHRRRSGRCSATWTGCPSSRPSSCGWCP